MVEIVLLKSFIVVKVFLLELLKNYLVSLKEMRRDVSLSWSTPKLLEGIWHFVLTQGIALLVFFFQLTNILWIETAVIRSGISQLEQFHSISPAPLSASGNNFQSQILKMGNQKKKECLRGLKEFLPQIFI